MLPGTNSNLILIENCTSIPPNIVFMLTNVFNQLGSILNSSLLIIAIFFFIFYYICIFFLTMMLDLLI